MNRRPGESPLTKSFSDHLSSLPKKVLKPIMRIVAQFTVRLIDTREVTERLKPFSIDIRHAVKRWRRWALSSFYWGNLWRAIISNNPKSWEVYPDDIILLKSYLRQSDLRAIDDMYYTRSVSRLSPEVVLDLQKKLQKHALVMYYRYLRFVAQYDKGLPSEDLISSILEAGIRALRRYEHDQDPNKILNYAKRASRNEAINLVTRYTRTKRVRLLRSRDVDREYFCRTVSLEYAKSYLKHEFASDPLFDTIRVQLGLEYERYARAILGKVDDFDDWVATNHQAVVDRMPIKRVEFLARQWSGVTSKQAKTYLAPLLAEQIQHRPNLECTDLLWV